MHRMLLSLAAVAASALSIVGSAQAAKVDGYPSRFAVASAIKAGANETPEAAGYKWRYSKVTCQDGGAPGALTCNGIGRWRHGHGSVMTSIDWLVSTTQAGDYTAVSTWTFTGHTPGAGYPSSNAVARDVKSTANKTPTAAGYKWRYNDVSCGAGGAPATFVCSGVGRWRLGWGRVMTSIKWDVTTTSTGAYTATAIYQVAGNTHD